MSTNCSTNNRDLKFCTSPCGIGYLLQYDETNVEYDLLSETVVLTLAPITVNSGQKVKLDSFAQIIADYAAPPETINIAYELQRNGVTIVPLQVLDMSSGEAAYIKTYHPNFTWIDTPSPGTYVYTVNIYLV